MKTLLTLISCICIMAPLWAQNDTTEVKMMKKNVMTLIEDGKTTHIRVGNDKGVEVITDSTGDTTHIRIGRKTFRVIEGNNGTLVKIDKEAKTSNHNEKFDPHWTGLEFGVNMYRHADYSLYRGMNPPVTDEFMDLHYGKSISVNLNLMEWAFQNKTNNLAMVTGLGISFMDLSFDLPITIEKREGDGIIMPVALDPDGLKKSKLNLTYLTLPVLLEVKTPLRRKNSALHLSGGIIGGINIGSHTKYKYKGEKEKNRSNFNLNPFKCDLTGRLGFRNICLFVNYGLTPLFKENRGPELIPVTFGISFSNN